MGRETAGYLEKLAKLVRYYIIVMTEKAGSGHPTSSLSAVELTTALMFGGFFLYDADRPALPNNDRLVLSKGHASPLLYALWAVAGRVTEEELSQYRVFGSRLEGHPTPHFPYVDAATGSLGQGLSIGVGMALNAKYLDKLPYRTYVLLGDSEMAEGSNWEAMEIAAFYKLDNLVAILDVNRLGQRGETMYGWDVGVYSQRAAAFGWETVVIDGHNFEEIFPAFRKAAEAKEKPVMIIARTIKGKGAPAVENKNGWHGKPLSKEDAADAIRRLEPLDKSVRGEMTTPEDLPPAKRSRLAAAPLSYKPGRPWPPGRRTATPSRVSAPPFPTWSSSTERCAIRPMRRYFGTRSPSVILRCTSRSRTWSARPSVCRAGGRSPSSPPSPPSSRGPSTRYG